MAGITGPSWDTFRFRHYIPFFGRVFFHGEGAAIDVSLFLPYGLCLNNYVNLYIFRLKSFFVKWRYGYDGRAFGKRTFFADGEIPRSDVEGDPETGHPFTFHRQGSIPEDISPPDDA
jgi:hypothetical protein